MRVRKMDSGGDRVFGRGRLDFLADSAEAVALLVKARLGLWTGEWFLDVTEGTQWIDGILGHNTRATRDAVIRERILGTPGVRALLSYSSSLVSRRLSVTTTIDTIFGPATVAA